jgi:hypothetical protein
MKLYPVTVVEDFYENPDAVRAFALAQTYQYRHQQGDIGYVYPGGRTKDLFELNPALYEAVCKKLISVFHNSAHDHMRWLISTSFQSVSHEYGKGVIHTDGNTIIAAVLYLTPNAPLAAGTSLYRKNATFDQAKYDAALKENEDKYKLGEKAMSTAYHSMFDTVVNVSNVYNTLIIYEGDTFHAANDFFGQHLHDSRLAQVFFINRIDAKQHESFPLYRAKSVTI